MSNPYRKRGMQPDGSYINVWSVCNTHDCLVSGDTVKRETTFISVIRLGYENMHILVGWLFWALRPFETVFQSISGRLPERGRKK